MAEIEKEIITYFGNERQSSLQMVAASILWNNNNTCYRHLHLSKWFACCVIILIAAVVVNYFICAR